MITLSNALIFAGFALAVYWGVKVSKLEKALGESVRENIRLRDGGMSALMCDVADFHTTSTIPELQTKSTPALPLLAPQRETRMRLLKEEYEEYIEGEINADLPQIADGLADMVYIIVGTALVYGIPLDNVWREVQKSNMQKFEGGVRLREDGKILKPAGWKPPNIARVLRQAGHVEEMRAVWCNCLECEISRGHDV